MSKYLTYNSGEMNLILSAPHSGELSPKYIPTRKTGQRLKDGYTDRIIKGLIEYFDGKPYYIYANIHRSKVDLNRNVWEATQGSRRAEKIWYEWDTNLRYFLKNAERRFKRILYVDIHSHNNSDEFHLGYGISKKNFKRILTRNNENLIRTSLDAFSDGNKYDLILGEGSFKHTLEECGYRVFVPTDRDVYFSGGRNVRVYRSNKVGAIQVEVPTPLADRDLNGIISCLGDSIKGFMEKHVNDKPFHVFAEQSEHTENSA